MRNNFKNSYIMTTSISKHIRILAYSFSIAIIPACNNSSTNTTETKEYDGKSGKDSLQALYYDHGKKLFESNCNSCHAPDKRLVAPPFQRLREVADTNWIVAFVKNNETLRAKGDIRANYIYKKFGGMLMSTFPDLTKADIIAILDYVDTYPYDDKEYLFRKADTATMKKAVED